MVHDAALDVLAYPPRSVRGKAEAAFRVEFFQRMDQSEIPLLDQVEKRNAPIQVMLGDVHDEPLVVLDHALTCSEIASADQARGSQLLFRRQQWLGANLTQIKLGNVLE